MTTTAAEPTTIQEYATSLGVEYMGDVNIVYGGLFISPQVDEDYARVLQVTPIEDEHGYVLIAECLTVLLDDYWQDAHAEAIKSCGHDSTAIDRLMLIYAIVTYGHPYDPMQPVHMFDDSMYQAVIYDDEYTGSTDDWVLGYTGTRYPFIHVTDLEDDAEILRVLIPFIDNLL